MMSQRALQTSIKRLAARHTTRTGLAQFAAPVAVATNTHYIQRRHAVQSASDPGADAILVKQRLNRPVSPHLTIYRPQITWYGSAFNRITGCILSGGIYIFGSAYLIAPMVGWNLSSVSLAASFAAWPIAAKVLTKTLIAIPFTFHTINGLRHILWDFGVLFKNKEVQTTGWVVVGLSTVASIALALL